MAETYFEECSAEDLTLICPKCHEYNYWAGSQERLDAWLEEGTYIVKEQQQ
jgi:hypothetical protein